MDIFSVLKAEHSVVRGIFEKMMGTAEQAEETREELYDQLYREVHSHALAEQKIFYTRLEEEESMKQLMAEAEEEHAQVENMLQELGEMDTTTVEWTAKVTVLQESVERHVKEEESEMFRQARGVLNEDETEQLGEAFMQLKRELIAEMS
jgi:hypothetical protein